MRQLGLSDCKEGSCEPIDCLCAEQGLTLVIGERAVPGPWCVRTRKEVILWCGRPCFPTQSRLRGRISAPIWRSVEAGYRTSGLGRVFGESLLLTVAYPESTVIAVPRQSLVLSLAVLWCRLIFVHWPIDASVCGAPRHLGYNIGCTLLENDF